MQSLPRLITNFSQCRPLSAAPTPERRALERKARFWRRTFIASCVSMFVGIVLGIGATVGAFILLTPGAWMAILATNLLGLLWLTWRDVGAEVDVAEHQRERLVALQRAALEGAAREDLKLMLECQEIREDDKWVVRDCLDSQHAGWSVPRQATTALEHSEALRLSEDTNEARMGAGQSIGALLPR